MNVSYKELLLDKTIWADNIKQRNIKFQHFLKGDWLKIFVVDLYGQSSRKHFSAFINQVFNFWKPSAGY